MDVAVSVIVGVSVGVRVFVGVRVELAVRVREGVGVNVNVEVRVGVGVTADTSNVMSSKYTETVAVAAALASSCISANAAVEGALARPVTCVYTPVAALIVLLLSVLSELVIVQSVYQATITFVLLSTTPVGISIQPDQEYAVFAVTGMRFPPEQLPPPATPLKLLLRPVVTCAAKLAVCTNAGLLVIAALPLCTEVVNGSVLPVSKPPLIT